MEELGKIVVLEDEAEYANMLRLRLEAAGYTVRVANDPKTGLEVIEGMRPDLVLMDINMPGMTGFETCKILKNNSELADIPVIFLTARIATDDVLEGFDVGGVDYLTKPVDAKVLLARVKTHVSLKQASDKQRELILQLQESLAQIKQLKGLIPICAHCKKVRDDEGYWKSVEVYIEHHSEAQFSHGICTDCIQKLYPELADEI